MIIRHNINDQEHKASITLEFDSIDDYWRVCNLLINALTREIRSKKEKPDSRVHYLDKEVLFESRESAQAVLDSMIELLNYYGSVSVADYYELSGYVSDFNSNKYGWTNLDDAGVVQRPNGYILTLPLVNQL